MNTSATVLPADATPARSVTRRTALKLLAGSIAPAVISGCTSSADAKTLRVYWHPAHAYDAYKQVIARFEQDHPGWKVNWELYQWDDMHTKLLANFAAGTVPDLVEEPGGWVQEFGLAGHLCSLQSYLKKDGAGMQFPQDWQPCTLAHNALDGTIYGIQLHLTCVLNFYNNDLLEKAGITRPPATWEEFLEMARATTRNAVYGFVPNANSAYSWPWFLQNNARYYDAAKQAMVLDSPEGCEALQFQSDLIHNYRVAPLPVTGDYQAPQKLFSAGRAACIITGPWDSKAILLGSPDLHWQIAQALKHKVQATTLGGTSLIIPRAARNPALAWELLKRLVALEVMLAVTKEGGMTMPRKSWASDPAIRSLAHIAPFAAGLQYAQNYDLSLLRTGKANAIGTLYDKAFQDVIYRNRPASEALHEFTADANRLLRASAKSLYREAPL